MKGDDSIVFALRKNCKEWVKLDSEGRLHIVYKNNDTVIDKRDTVLMLRRINALQKYYKKK